MGCVRAWEKPEVMRVKSSGARRNIFRTDRPEASK
jgi:hypothetical protein